MAIALFQKQKTQREKPVPKPNEIYFALKQGIEMMRNSCVDYVLLNAYESARHAKGSCFVSLDKRTYFDVDVLVEPEQELINQHKTYRSNALVLEDVMGFVKFPHASVAIFHRNSVVPMLPKELVDAMPNLRYITVGCILPEEDLLEYCSDAKKDGWTPEMVLQRVKDGIEEYKDITHKLCENAGIVKTLEKLESRNRSSLDEILSSMRKNMAAAIK
ncbi:MAG: hypothetical protein AABW41_04160 [Nanoarchaeota archaeon]